MLASAGFLHYNDRHLLANVGQGSQQSPLLFRANDPQSFVPKLQLMKLQLHASSCCCVLKKQRQEHRRRENQAAPNFGPALFPLPLLLGHAELIQAT
jgi:hypothetical protein